jgi:hypothetical protein
METIYLLFLVEILFLVAMGFGLWLFVRALRRRMGGSRAGWAALEATWGVAEPPLSPLVTRGTLVVGKVLWRNCVAVAADPGGLHLAVTVPFLGAMGKKPVRIPWTAFHAPEPAKLYWGDATLWRLGIPEVATITLPKDLEARLAASGHRLGG